MTAKIGVVTGATSGIGTFIAQGLVEAGYFVVIVARNKSKAQAVLPIISGETSRDRQVAVEEADLSSVSSVKELAVQLTNRYDAISLLVNNAGVFATKKTLSQDGIELDLAVNHLAPFLLTWRLLPLLQAAAGGRVVNVNSDAHEKATLSLADFTPDAPFSMMRSYGKSKLANVLTTVEFARRVAPEVVTINAVHPGAVATNIGNSGGIAGVLWGMLKPFLLKPEKGAQTPLWAAISPELAGMSGNYYKKQALAAMNPLAQNRELSGQVWLRTLALLKLSEDSLAAH